MYNSGGADVNIYGLTLSYFFGGKAAGTDEVWVDYPLLGIIPKNTSFLLRVKVKISSETEPPVLFIDTYDMEFPQLIIDT